jgi:hypothetical protein
MATDHDKSPGARARGEGASNAMAYIIGAVLIAGIIAMVALFATERTSDSTPPTATVNQPQTTTPTSNTTTTTPTQPSTK